MLKAGKRKIVIAIAAAFVASVFVGLGNAANAGQATSALGYYTVNGHQYQNQAVIWTQTNYAYATTINGWSSGTATSGWAGARGRLFTSGGTLSCEGANTYNSAGVNNATGLSCSRSTSGAWYSYGVALGWNGSGYTSFYTYQSPNQHS